MSHSNCASWRKTYPRMDEKIMECEMENPIAKDTKDFIKTLKNYVKHQGLELELTLNNGQRIIIERNRKLEGNDIVQYFDNQEGIRVNLNDIKRADVYSV